MNSLSEIRDVKNRNVMARLADAARNINAITLEAAARKQAHNGKMQSAYAVNLAGLETRDKFDFSLIAEFLSNAPHCKSRSRLRSL
jgi:hypothetical protein